MRLNIFGKKMRVLKKKGMATDMNIRGLFEPSKALITIDADLVGDEYLQCLIHEICHAVFYRTGIDQAQIQLGVEEIICENIATIMVETFNVRLK